MIKFIAGLFLGGMVGIFFTACTTAAKDGDEILARSEDDGE